MYRHKAITIRVKKRMKKKTYNNTKAIQYFIELKQNEKEKQWNNECECESDGQ